MAVESASQTLKNKLKTIISASKRKVAHVKNDVAPKKKKASEIKWKAVLTRNELIKSAKKQLKVSSHKKPIGRVNPRAIAGARAKAQLALQKAKHSVHKATKLRKMKKKWKDACASLKAKLAAAQNTVNKKGYLNSSNDTSCRSLSKMVLRLKQKNKDAGCG